MTRQAAEALPIFEDDEVNKSTVRITKAGLEAAGWRPDTDEPPPEGWERAA